MAPFKHKNKPILGQVLFAAVFSSLTAYSSESAPRKAAEVKPQASRVIPAFPGAEGFGANAVGGRGGKVIEVTNLSDSGPGSLRAALQAAGPRTVVFRVGGTIVVKSKMTVSNPYLTVAGQTAPGGGITLRNDPANGKMPLLIDTHDVVLRYLRIRPGPSRNDSGNLDAMDIGSYNIIVDHCSFSWATDEVLTSGGGHDVTIQWSIISEGLNNSTHPKGAHSKGLHLREANSDRISVHHNLLAHNYDRNPNITSSGIVDFVNNVVYNATRWTEVKDKFGEPQVNVIGNYYKLGPSSGKKSHEVFYYKTAGRRPQVYVKGNIGFHRPAEGQPELAVVREDSRWMMTDKAFPAPPISMDSAAGAFQSVLANAGATRPQRDAVDLRIVQEVLNGTGKVIDDPSEVGGWPELAAGTAPKDSDHDGMPDSWEEAHGTDKNDPADGARDRGDGYSKLEEYLNNIAG